MKKEETYIKYLCKNCANKHTDKCEIKTFVINNEIITKCIYYKKEERV